MPGQMANSYFNCIIHMVIHLLYIFTDKTMEGAFGLLFLTNTGELFIARHILESGLLLQRQQCAIECDWHMCLCLQHRKFVFKVYLYYCSMTVQ